MLNKYTGWCSVVLLLACNSSNGTKIPSVSNPKLQTDGLFQEEAWNRSRSVQITTKHTLYLMQDANDLYLGVKSDEDTGRYLDLYLHNDSIGTINIHASFQLGERKLERQWDDEVPAWNWGNNAGWMANKVESVSEVEDLPFLDSVKPYEGFEFRISKAKIKNDKARVRLEIRDFRGQAGDIVFPPDSERLTTENWFELDSQFAHHRYSATLVI